MDFQTTHKHMSELVRDYGAPIVAFSLIKKFEDQPKETILGAQFHYCIGTLRETPQFDADLLQYLTFDFLKVRLAPFCAIARLLLSTVRVVGSIKSSMVTYRTPSRI